MKRIALPAVAVAVCGLMLGSVALARQDDKSKDKSANKDEKKWTTTATGLQYLDEKEGIGAKVRVDDIVVVHYTGTFKDGKKFDSSKDRKEPYEFRVGARQVIKGWDEGLVGMKVGGTRKLIIPYVLAYGEKGREGIPPKTDLHFEIELLKIK